MSDIERITVTVTSAMVRAMRGAIEEGEYASSSEIIREALRDWKYKKILQDRRLEELRADVQEGLADVKAGRVKKFSSDRVIKKGKRRLARREPSA